jgi:hypothetical protein
MREICENANIDPPASFHRLGYAWASQAVMGCMPLLVVVQNLGQPKTRMIEKHYGHLARRVIGLIRFGIWAAVRLHATGR